MEGGKVNQALWDQIALWALTGAITALCIVIFAIGRHIITKIDATSNEVAKLRTKIAEDFGAVRERLARVEGTVFPRGARSDD